MKQLFATLLVLSLLVLCLVACGGDGIKAPEGGAGDLGTSSASDAPSCSESGTESDSESDSGSGTESESENGSGSESDSGSEMELPEIKV